MPRRSSRPKLHPDDAELPDGFTRHTGGPIAVALDARPALFFRNGSKMRAGTYAADHWDTFEGGSCWEWRGRKPDHFDILGFRLEE